VRREGAGESIEASGTALPSPRRTTTAEREDAAKEEARDGVS
jgi:hypothetical protein